MREKNEYLHFINHSLICDPLLSTTLMNVQFHTKPGFECKAPDAQKEIERTSRSGVIDEKIVDAFSEHIREMFENGTAQYSE